MTIDPDLTPNPGLAERYALTVTVAEPLVIGTLATGGVREHRGATGGSFLGSGVEGEVIGGGETLLRRPDGIGVMEANYLVRTADGAVIRIIGTGYLTDDGEFRGTRMTIVFEVGEGGPHAHLSTRAFVAERPTGSARIAIAEIL